MIKKKWMRICMTATLAAAVVVGFGSVDIGRSYAASYDETAQAEQKPPAGTGTAEADWAAYNRAMQIIQLNMLLEKMKQLQYDQMQYLSR